MKRRMQTGPQTERLIHFLKVSLVPRFGHLAVLDTRDGDARKLHRIVRRGKAEMIASVLTAHVATSNNAVALSDNVFHAHVHIRKRAAKLPVKTAKGARAAHRISGRTKKAMNHDIISQQLVDCFST